MAVEDKRIRVMESKVEIGSREAGERKRLGRLSPPDGSRDKCTVKLACPRQCFKESMKQLIHSQIDSASRSPQSPPMLCTVHQLPYLHDLPMAPSLKTILGCST